MHLRDFLEKKGMVSKALSRFEALVRRLELAVNLLQLLGQLLRLFGGTVFRYRRSAQPRPAPRLSWNRLEDQAST